MVIVYDKKSILEGVKIFSFFSLGQTHYKKEHELSLKISLKAHKPPTQEEVVPRSIPTAHFLVILSSCLKLDLEFSNVENSVAMYFIMQVPQCLLVQELSSQSEENKSI